jgi:hypothetical protein
MLERGVAKAEIIAKFLAGCAAEGLGGCDRPVYEGFFGQVL